MSKEATGIIPPLTTPFTEEGNVYEEGLRRLVEFQIEKGSKGLYICGTYGSGPIMSITERKKVHEIVCKQNKGRITIISHVGTPSTAQSIELAKHALNAGTDIVASVPPYYYSHDNNTVIQFFEAVVKCVDIPVYVYNNPKTTGITLTPMLLRQLSEVGVKGIKDSSFSFVEFSHFVLNMKDVPEFRFIVGTEAIVLPAHLIGAKGCVSGLANCFPELMVELWELLENRKYHEAGKLQLRVNRARQILHIPTSTNAACYTALDARGIDVGRPKAPILPVEKEKANEMLTAFKDIGLL